MSPLSVVKIPWFESSSNQRSMAAFSSVFASPMDSSVLFPPFNRADQTIQRGNAQHDDQIAAHLRIPQLESRMDDERVAHRLAIDQQRLEHALQRVQREVGDRERNLDVEEIAKRAETRVQQDVADLG